jgi:hypothetical protein
MNAETHPWQRMTDFSMKHSPIWSDLPPEQAGLAAALRRAFTMPADETARMFEELLRKIS